MSVRYAISQALNLCCVFCDGHTTGQQYQDVVYAVMRDPRYVPGMPRLVDLHEAESDFDVDAMRRGVAHNEQLAASGRVLDPTILLSRADAIHLFVRTVHALSARVRLQFWACRTIDQAIELLGLGDRTAEVVAFYEEAKRTALPPTHDAPRWS